MGWDEMGGSVFQPLSYSKCWPWTRRHYGRQSPAGAAGPLLLLGGETLWLSCAIIYPSSAAGRHVGPWQRAGVLYQPLCKSAVRGGRRQHCLISFRHSNNLQRSDWYLHTTKRITPAESHPPLCVCVWGSAIRVVRGRGARQKERRNESRGDTRGHLESLNESSSNSFTKRSGFQREGWEK